MKIELKDILALIETKTSWGKEQLKEAILTMLANKQEFNLHNHTWLKYERIENPIMDIIEYCPDCQQVKPKLKQGGF